MIEGAAREELLLTAGYQARMRALAPSLWYRFNEPSGNTAINHGSLGATYNGTYTACTLAQAGKTGPGDAVLYDGATSLLTIPAGPFGNYAQRTLASLVNMTGTGEGTKGAFYDWATSTTLRFNFANTFRALRAAATAAASNTLTGLTLSAWSWLFVTYDNTGDRMLHVYLGIGGVVTEYGYSAQTAALGAVTDQSAVVYAIGNATIQDRTLAGLYDEHALWNSILTPTQMLSLVRGTNV